MTFRNKGKKTEVHFILMNKDTGKIYKRSKYPTTYFSYWNRKTKGENVIIFWETCTFRKGIK